MAPEQARGRNEEVGRTADVYALGVILYECITGRLPLQGSNPADTLDQLLTKDAVKPEELVPSVPRDLSTIGLKCLRKEPERRYGSALELAEDLRRYLDDQPILARSESPRERFAKWRRRNPQVFRWILLSAAALIAGSLFSVGFGVYASGQARKA